MMQQTPLIDLVAIACSAGGLRAMLEILSKLPSDFPVPIVVAQHRGDRQESYLPSLLGAGTRLKVKDAHHLERLTPGVVHVCPAGMHIELANCRLLRVADGPKINFVKPSADLLFRSVANIFGARAVCVVLSGNGCDGAMGARAVRAAGGIVIAQDEASSDYPGMPTAAMDIGRADLALSLDQIPFALACLTGCALEPGRAEVNEEIPKHCIGYTRNGLDA